MPFAITAAEIESMGVDAGRASDLAERCAAAWRGLDPRNGVDQVGAWASVRVLLLTDMATRWDFPLHLGLYRHVFRERSAEDGPPPAWSPPAEVVRAANATSVQSEAGCATFKDLHRWSIENRERFWSAALRRLGIVFRSPPQRILDSPFDVASPNWLPGAVMNIAESCFRADPAKNAIVSASEESPVLRRTSYEELRRLSARVANGLEAFGVAPGERVALYMPMTPEAVAIYLGVILSGRSVVGIADTSAPLDLEKRARIGGAKAIFTIDSYRRDGKDLPIYDKVVAAEAPPAVVLPREGQASSRLRRPVDKDWQDFLSPRDAFEPARCAPSDVTNVLFSSGTTKDPKAIVWTHVTPIKSAADAYFHQDVHQADVLAWPTSYGWMMGPWLTYAALVNRATIALYVGGPTGRAFGQFVQEAGVTILGVVPKLVRSWRSQRTMEGLDWSAVRLFSSTAEPSSPEDMLYLMFLAGYRPIVEYCGGTEVGGGYITGSVVQPCAPGTFTTPALGLDLVILEDGHPADRGEVFLVPPSIGLSNEVLNYDNREEYLAGVPPGPNGETLRRHGDQIERLGGGYYRHRGRIDDTINVNGVKTSSEEIRGAIANQAVYDAKPIAVDVDGKGQASLVIYAVPRDPSLLTSEDFRARLRTEFQLAIKERLNPLLAHVHDVVLVSELPEAGPGKTRTMKELQSDYRARSERRAS
ncbi:MAG TPA: AMP-binding protein [Thermoplasmata archaeon]|nr:AMP-binding protein [Thermoplasmata archaeon]